MISTGPNLPLPAVRGGAVHRFWSQMTPAFARRGHQVTVCARAWPQQSAGEVVDGVRFRRSGGFDLSRSRLRDYARSLLWALGSTAGLPRGDVYVSNDLFSPWLLAARGRARRTLVAVGRAPKGQYRFYPRELNLAVPTQAIRDAVAAEAPHLDKQCHVLPYAIDTHCFKPAARQGARNQLLFAGRIHPEKGLELLIAAFRQLSARDPALRLRIIGPVAIDQGGAGEGYRKALEEKTRDLPVEWLDPLYDTSALADVYRACGRFIYPSISESGETFGVAALEAMACGAVPVVSALGCFRDFVRHGANGAIFDHRRPDAVQALVDAIDLAGGERAAELAEAAQCTALEYSLDAVAERWLGVLNQIAGVR